MGKLFWIEEECPCCTYRLTTIFDEKVITTHEHNQNIISNSKYLELMKIYNEKKDIRKIINDL